MTETWNTPGIVIRLSERSHEGGQFNVRVCFGEEAEYDVVVADPTDPTGEASLAWYFEEHLRYPFLDKDLEEQAVQRIVAYGETLFMQVFDGAASHDYRKLRDRSFDGCRIEVSGSAALHRLHWEALRDPELDTPLAVRLPVTRRVHALGSKFELPDRKPTLNILVVSARPDGPADVGHRTISRPLMDALRTAGLPVTVDLVRPGTWESLRKHLQNATERNGSGWYHVTHFDLHGTFSDYVTLEEKRQAQRLLFSPGQGTFQGKRGFLFFETAEAGIARAVPAEEVASLLAEHRVPIAVLNACQSATQTATEAGLAQRLAEAGVPISVGMSYSVTVSAAEQAMPVLYGRFADGSHPVNAVHAARRNLFEHQARQAYFGQQLSLQDWMLPVMFAQRPLRVHLREMTDDEQSRFYERAALVGDEPAVKYGFVGRDLDIQALEHRLLARRDSNGVLVQGMAGAGKSTFLNHLAWWWQRTGLVDRVFRFSYEDQAWTSSQIIRDIRSTLLSPAEHARADSMPQAAQLEQVAELLRANRHLLIIDNAESITAAPASVPHALRPPEQQRLLTLLSRLRGGRTLVLIGSREPETWLTADNAGYGIYPLLGLDSQASSVLTERILQRHGAAHYLTNTAERVALMELVTLLGGYPLPLSVVLPVIASLSPSTVLAELKAGGPAPDQAKLINRAIEYSYSKLDSGLQKSLLLLAPFTSVITTGKILNNYCEILEQDETIKELGRVDLPSALEQAVKLGLATPHPRFANMVQLHPVLPYFLRNRLATQPELRAGTEQAHYRVYTELVGGVLYATLTSGKDPEQWGASHISTRDEYINLTSALTHGLRTSQPIDRLVRPLAEYLKLIEEHEARRHLIDGIIADYPQPTERERQRELAVLHDLAAGTAIAQRRLDDAIAHLEKALSLCETIGDCLAQAGPHQGLAMVAQQQRRFTEAEAHCRKALEIVVECGHQDGTAIVFHTLGMIAQDQWQLEAAETNYRNALQIRLNSGDERGAAETYHQLGVLANLQRRYAEAASSHHASLKIHLKFGDHSGAARAYHELGILAKEQRQFAEADVNYRKALDSRLETGDQRNAALTYAELAQVAESQRRYDEAEEMYRKAINIFRDYGDDYHEAFTLSNLAMLSREQERWVEAETRCREALRIFQRLGDLSGAGRASHNLGIMAHEQRRYDDAEANYQKALDIRLSSGDRHGTAATFHNLGMIAQEKGLYVKAAENYRNALDLHLGFDQLAASGTATGLGIVLAQLGRHDEAAQAFLCAAITWHEETRHWPSHNLQQLHREREIIGSRQFAILVKTYIRSPNLEHELAAAVDASEDPEDDEAG